MFANTMSSFGSNAWALFRCTNASSQRRNIMFDTARFDVQGTFFGSISSKAKEMGSIQSKAAESSALNNWAM